MYTEYFGLKEKPFSIAPDPQYFYMSQGHREALAHLLYGIRSEGGFVLLTGEVGTGKTTVCRLLLQMIPPDTETAFILNPKLTAEELLGTVCDEFGITYPPGTASIKTFVSLINDFLLKVHEKSHKAVLIIEEAQNLTPDVLEQIRLLTNLETNERKLLQIIMLGQPELRDILSRPELRQLSQRITARYHLGALSKKEVPSYVNYRLSVAGLLRSHPFPRSTLRPLFSLTQGVPRMINIILDRALLGAFAEGKDKVDRKTLVTAAREVRGERKDVRTRFLFQTVLGGFALLTCAALASGFYYYGSGVRVGSKTVFSARLQDSSEGKNASSPSQPGLRTSLSDKDEAYRTLFSEWQVEYEPADNRTVCDQAARRGLYCLEATGTIASLRRIDRPAVLVLKDEDGTKHYAALTALSDKTATLASGEDLRTVNIEEVEQTWTGDYLLIWRGPPNVDQLLKPGSRGPLVTWLDRQLAVVQGRPARVNKEQIYDEEIMRHVREFQKTAGLQPDGIAGPRTIMQIAVIAGEGGPVLRRRAQ